MRLKISYYIRTKGLQDRHIFLFLQGPGLSSDSSLVRSPQSPHIMMVNSAAGADILLWCAFPNHTHSMSFNNLSDKISATGLNREKVRMTF